MDALLLVVVVFFAGMGVVALVAPARVAATNDSPPPSLAARNEIRAVYGGFGLAVAALLVLATRDAALAPGIFLTVAGALAGMAAGRLVSALVERPARFYPSWFYCVVELAMAAVLWRGV
jgi:hypothetical protein